MLVKRNGFFLILSLNFSKFKIKYWNIIVNPNKRKKACDFSFLHVARKVRLSWKFRHRLSIWGWIVFQRFDLIFHLFISIICFCGAVYVDNKDLFPFNFSRVVSPFRDAAVHPSGQLAVLWRLPGSQWSHRGNVGHAVQLSNKPANVRKSYPNVKIFSLYIML